MPRAISTMFQAAGMAAVDILINNAGLALGVASAIEPLAIGLDGRYLDPQNGHTDQKMFRKNVKIWRCNFSGYINGAIEKMDGTIRLG